MTAANNTTNKFSVTVNMRFVLFYMALFLLFTQLHELSHIITGRLVCGCYGAQADFNIWTLCGTCFENNPYGFLPVLAGPVFSFAGVWIGVYLLRAKDQSNIFLGFLLVLINKPFARLFTVLMKGGDELNAARKLLSDKLPDSYIWIISLSVILLLSIPPLYSCYKKLKNKRKLLLVAGLCVGPMIFQYCYEFKLLNKLLEKGWGAGSPYMGIANLIHLHTLLILFVCLFLFKSIKKQQLLQSLQQSAG